MPKSTKKKKEKAKDFTKAKLKLGKGKQAASNAVDTSFKARSIVLPNQSITAVKDELVPSTRRRLTLPDLLGHLKHHNTTIRKDALAGVQELLASHPQLISSSLNMLLPTCARLIGDEDASVRKALQGLLSRIVATVPVSELLPHSQTLLLFTASAQSHIFPEIRVEATKVLRILLECIPQAVVTGWDALTVESNTGGSGTKHIRGLLGLLNASPKQADASVTVSAFNLSPTSKLIVLETLTTFMIHALHRFHEDDSDELGIPLWYFALAFRTPAAFEAFIRLLPNSLSYASRKFIWQPQISHTEDLEDHAIPLPDELAWTLDDVATSSHRLGELPTEGQSSSTSTPRGDVVVTLIESLQPLITSTILDNAPMVLSPSAAAPPEIDLQLILLSLRLARCLYADALQGSYLHASQKRKLCKLLSGYLMHLAPYFPFAPTVPTRREMKTEQHYQDLNVIYCELVSTFLLASSGDADSATSKKVHKEVDPVTAYLIRLLDGKMDEGTYLPLSLQTYQDLLPSIWILLFNEATQSSTVASDIVHGLLSHDRQVSTQSPTKRASTEFIVRLILLSEDRLAVATSLSKNNDVIELFRAWIVDTPKVLWELGSKNVKTSKLILVSLIRILQRQSRLVNDETRTEICRRLKPYFVIDHATKGALPGPFSRLPPTSEVRQVVLQLVRLLSTPLSGSAPPADAALDLERAAEGASVVALA